MFFSSVLLIVIKRYSVFVPLDEEWLVTKQYLAINSNKVVGDQTVPGNQFEKKVVGD